MEDGRWGWMESGIGGVGGLFTGLSVAYGLIKKKVRGAHQRIDALYLRIDALQDRHGAHVTDIAVLRSQHNEIKDGLAKVQEGQQEIIRLLMGGNHGSTTRRGS